MSDCLVLTWSLEGQSLARMTAEALALGQSILVDPDLEAIFKACRSESLRVKFSAYATKYLRAIGPQ